MGILNCLKGYVIKNSSKIFAMIKFILRGQAIHFVAMKTVVKLFPFSIQVRKLWSSGAARGVRIYSLFQTGLEELTLIMPDRAHLLRKGLVTG